MYFYLDMHIFDEVTALRDRRPCNRARRNLFDRVVSYGMQIGIPWEAWSNRELFQFVHEWDADFSRKPQTVRRQFDQLVIVCRNATWVNDLCREGKQFKELVNLYLRLRAERFGALRSTKQAEPLSLETARAVSGHLLGQHMSGAWQAQLHRVRILALAFAFVGGCRVGDLQHIKWGRIFLGQLEGKPAVYAVLDWSKTNMYGVKDDDVRIFPSFEHKILCPVHLWTLFKDKLPAHTKGPFFSVRTDRAFSTEVITRGWKAAASALGLQTNFTAHSCRRARITSMRDWGLSDAAIRKILGYAANSKMPTHYDKKKRVGNKAQVEKEIKFYVSKMLSARS